MSNSKKAMRDYPSTSDFPAYPAQLERPELEQSYLQLRQHYKGLSISRGQFASKAQTLQKKLEKQNEELNHVMEALEKKTKTNKELNQILEDLTAISLKQKALVADLNDEFKAVRDDLSLNVVDRFNRIIRAVYRFLHQDIAPPQPKIVPPEESSWDKEDPRSMGQSLLDR